MNFIAVLLLFCVSQCIGGSEIASVAITEESPANAGKNLDEVEGFCKPQVNVSGASPVVSPIKVKHIYNPMEPIFDFGYNHFGVPDVAKLCVVIDEAISRGEEEINILNVGSFSWISSKTSFLNENYPDVKFNLCGITSADQVNFPFCGDNSLIDSFCDNNFFYSEGNCSIVFLTGFKLLDFETAAFPEFHFIISNGAFDDFDNPKDLFTAFYDRLCVNGIFMTSGLGLLNNAEESDLKKVRSENYVALFSFLYNLGGDFLMVDGNFPEDQGEVYWTLCARKKNSLRHSCYVMKVSRVIEWDLRNRGVQYVEGKNSTLFSTFIASPLRKKIIDFSFRIIGNSHYLMGLFVRSSEYEKEPLLALELVRINIIRLKHYLVACSLMLRNA